MSVGLNDELLVLGDESSSSEEEDESDLQAIDLTDAKQFVWTADGKRTVEVPLHEKNNRVEPVPIDSMFEESRSAAKRRAETGSDVCVPERDLRSAASGSSLIDVQFPRHQTQDRHIVGEDKKQKRPEAQSEMTEVLSGELKRCTETIAVSGIGHRIAELKADAEFEDDFMTTAVAKKRTGIQKRMVTMLKVVVTEKGAEWNFERVCDWMLLTPKQEQKLDSQISKYIADNRVDTGLQTHARTAADDVIEGKGRCQVTLETALRKILLAFVYITSDT